MAKPWYCQDYWVHWRPQVVFELFVGGGETGPCCPTLAPSHIASMKQTCHLEISAEYREVSIYVEN